MLLDFELRPRFIAFALPDQQGKQSQRPQRKAQGVKRKRPHIGIAQTLGDEGKTPNGSR